MPRLCFIAREKYLTLNKTASFSLAVFVGIVCINNTLSNTIALIT